MKRIQFFLIMVLAACGTASVPTARAPVVLEEPVRFMDDPAPKPRVVLVLVDGLRSDLAATMPAWQGLAKDGAWTLKARTERLPITVVSHAAIFTGVGMERNGVSKHEPGQDADLATWRPLKVKETIFTIVHAAGLSTAAVIRKQKLRGLLPEESVDALFFAKDDRQSIEAACGLLASDGARLMYVHLSELDAVGHDKGWMSQAQKSAAVRISHRIDELRACIKHAESVFGQPVYLLFTSDHGGHGRSHGDDIDVDRLVPWVLVGHDVAAGRELPKTVRLIDTAAVIQELLVQHESSHGLEGKVPEGLFAP